MANEDPTSEEFQEAVERLIRRFRGRLDPSRIASGLASAASSLAQSPDEAGITFDELTGTLHVVFHDADELKERLPEFCELRAIVVDADLPMHQDVVVRVSGAGRAVELMGRVVQELPSGRCVQIDRLDDITETRLRALPDRMREPGCPDSGNFTPVAAGASRRIPFETPVPSEPPAVRAGSPDSGFARQPTLAQHRPPAAPSRTWSIGPDASDSLGDVLLALVANNATGLLELVGANRRLILVDRGNFLDVGSEPEDPEDSLEALLLRSKTIDEDDVEKVREYRNRFAVGSSEAFLNLGIVEWNDLQIGLRTRIRYLLRDVWSFDGKAQFFPLEDLPAKPLAKPVRILNFVFGHRSEVLADDELDESIQGYLLRPPKTLPPVLATIELLPQHQDILSINFMNGKGVNELLRLARSQKSEARAAIESLVRLGFLETVELRPLSRVQTSSVRQVDILHARLGAESHFEVFGLHWSAYDAEVKKRYEELQEKFTPERFGDALDDELRGRLQEVRARMEEAWKVLRVRARRREHRHELIDPFQIENSVQMFESRADTAMLRREIDDAIDFLRRILELQPERREFEAKLKQLQEIR